MSTGGYGTDGLFSDSRTLSGRQRELDAVRGLSVFLMVGAHVMNQFQPVSDGSGGGIIDFIATTVTGAFPGGANCFMMVMGIVMLSPPPTGTSSAGDSCSSSPVSASK